MLRAILSTAKFKLFMADFIDCAFLFAEIIEVSAPMAVIIINVKIVKATMTSIIENPFSELVFLSILLFARVYISPSLKLYCIPNTILFYRDLTCTEYTYSPQSTI